MQYQTTRTDAQIEAAFQEAAEQYAAFGVNAHEAVDKAADVPISLHCWQADDVAGFETKDEAVEGGGIMATGNYPGRARNGDELRADLKQAIDLLPGRHRANVHASYGDTGGKVVDRDRLEPEHFAGWISWAKENGIGLDFNPTYFAHPKANDGYTLAHPDVEIREFWVRHGVASRRIAEAMGIALEDVCVNNHWIPDGAKDHPADRYGPRERLVESLDAVLDPALGIGPACVDAVEGKLFGLGVEDYTAGSNDFYANYALSRGAVLCLDMGHFHPTESIADKISSHLPFHDRLLIHTSRPIRWDSDHVVLFGDDVRNVFLEIVRCDALDRVYVALDFFDASINRVAAWAIGTRNSLRALLLALLEPRETMQEIERNADYTTRLALMEELKAMPHAAVWDYHCLQQDVPVGMAFMQEIRQYEKDVQSLRD